MDGHGTKGTRNYAGTGPHAYSEIKKSDLSAKLPVYYNKHAISGYIHCWML